MASTDIKETPTGTTVDKPKEEGTDGTKGDPGHPPGYFPSPILPSPLQLLFDVLTLAGIVYLCVVFTKRFKVRFFDFS